MTEIGIECETEMKVNGFSPLCRRRRDMNIYGIYWYEYIWYEYTTIIMCVFSSIFFPPFFNLCTPWWSSWRWSLTTRISFFLSFLRFIIPFSSISLPFLLLSTLFWFNLYSNLEKFTGLNLLTLKESSSLTICMMNSQLQWKLPTLWLYPHTISFSPFWAEF